MKILEQLLMAFRNKKNKKKKKLEGLQALKSVCGRNIKVYEALLGILQLNGPSPLISFEECIRKAKEYETGNRQQAAIWYRLAAQRALFEGNREEVERCLRKCEELTSEKQLILTVLEKAVEKSQEYYRKFPT